MPHPFMTTTATTKRHPAKASGKITAAVDNLSTFYITAPTPPENRGGQRNMAAQGMEGAHVHEFECYTESQTHTDSGVSVTQMPDIQVEDKLVTGGVTYAVIETGIWPATSGFSETRYIYMDKDV